MNDEWLSLEDDKEIKYLLNGKLVVIKPKDNFVPIFCPLCTFPLTNSEDFISFKQNNLCYCCDIHWKKPNTIKWAEEDWRPNSQSELWKEYIEEREIKILNKKIILK